MTTCTYPHGDQRTEHQATIGQLCQPGYLRLEQHLAELPALVGWLHANLASGGSGAGEVLTGTREKSTPIKVGIHDHLVLISDTLLSWARMIAEERDLHGPANTQSNTTASFLLAHLPWSAAQDWIVDLATEANDLHRDAHRLSPSKPAKHRLPVPCPSCDLLGLVRSDGDDYIGCEACGRLWQEVEYRRLTVILAEEARRAS